MSAADARPGGALRLYYGGTFDPVHCGHLATARAARDALWCDVRFVPAADPPHRPPPGATAGQRVAMLRLALRGEPGLRLDLRELERQGRSWTVDTLRDLRAALGPDAPLAWLVGADSFRSLPEWHDWEALFGLAHFVVARREGSPLDRLPPALEAAVAGRRAGRPGELRASPHGRVLFLAQPLRLESATGIRQGVATGGDWRKAVPQAVAAYIAAHGLYGASGATDGAGV